MKTIIAEKPSVAREIARIVKATKRETGYYAGAEYNVTWAFGHLVQPALPDGYGIEGFHRDNLPIIPPVFQLVPRQVKADKGYKPDSEAAARAKATIMGIARDIKVGDVYMGKVVRIMNFGAFVELVGGKDGLVHISKLDNKRVEKVEDVVNIGDEILVKVIEIDSQNRINLTHKGVTMEDLEKFNSTLD